MQLHINAVGKTIITILIALNCGPSVLSYGLNRTNIRHVKDLYMSPSPSSCRRAVRIMQQPGVCPALSHNLNNSRLAVRSSSQVCCRPTVASHRRFIVHKQLLGHPHFKVHKQLQAILGSWCTNRTLQAKVL